MLTTLVVGGVAALDQRTQYTLEVDGEQVELVTFSSDVRAATLPRPSLFTASVLAR